MDVVKLVIPEPPKRDDRLFEEIDTLLEEAKSGQITGFICVKFHPEGKFAVRKVGHLSDLEVCGALDFCKYDIMVNNTPR